MRNANVVAAPPTTGKRSGLIPMYGYISHLHLSDPVRLPRTRVKLKLPNRPRNNHWKTSDLMAESTCSLLPICSKRTSNVIPNAFFGRSERRQPKIAIRTGFRINKLLIVVRRLNALHKELRRISASPGRSIGSGERSRT